MWIKGKFRNVPLCQLGQCCKHRDRWDEQSHFLHWCNRCVPPWKHVFPVRVQHVFRINAHLLLLHNPWRPIGLFSPSFLNTGNSVDTHFLQQNHHRIPVGFHKQSQTRELVLQLIHCSSTLAAYYVWSSSMEDTSWGACAINWISFEKPAWHLFFICNLLNWIQFLQLQAIRTLEGKCSLSPLEAYEDGWSDWLRLLKSFCTISTLALSPHFLCSLYVVVVTALWVNQKE